MLLLLLLRLGDHDQLRLRGLLLTHSRVLLLAVVRPFLLDCGYLVVVIAAAGSVSCCG